MASSPLFMDDKHGFRRPSIKSWHSHWKDKLRENCLQRVEKSRNQILWKIRLSGQALQTSQDGAKIAFGDIVVDELQRLKQTTNAERSHLRSDPDSMLWEYEPSGALSELGNDGYEELMISMQNILYEELRTENYAKDKLLLEDFEKSCEQEDCALSAMLEQLQSNEDGVACPICKVGKLQQNKHLIYCNCGHLRLDVQHEKSWETRIWRSELERKQQNLEFWGVSGITGMGKVEMEMGTVKWQKRLLGSFPQQW